MTSLQISHNSESSITEAMSTMKIPALPLGGAGWHGIDIPSLACVIVFATIATAVVILGTLSMRYRIRTDIQERIHRSNI
ncbi:hypothetical protein BDZ45DRAFT_749194 [Acephala macrosclerotiorum]|nr:hypothetical protein BDZ45DRAFT_749194 [Acephala macrosclerotiorum]